MDTEALRKEEERLLRAISRGGASRPPVWSNPSKNPNPTATPKSTVIKTATTPTPTPTSTSTKSQSNLVSPRTKSVLSDEERQRLEREALEREKQRERERLEAERLEKEVFEQKRMASRTSLYSWFDTSPRISSSQPTEPKTTSKVTIWIILFCFLSFLFFFTCVAI
jgi:ABC-type Na+ efflux pump permease subunit